MKPLICLYCEGTDTKIVVIEKEKDSLKVIKTVSFDVGHGSFSQDNNVSDLKLEGDTGGLSIEGLDTGKSTVGGQAFSISLLAGSLADINLKKCLFLPAITEPALYYHVFEGTKAEASSKLSNDIIEDVQRSKNISIDKENLTYVELTDKNLLAVFTTGEINCVNMINSLARYNGRRYYTITALKSAEITLATYIAKKKKFFPDDHSLIVYIGKEYSKLIFLNGRKLKHIGSTLDVGTLNLHTYDVYFSKILLEMENGGIPHLDNIVVCGEDDSENLILSFYGTFPEANVSKLEFEDIDLSLLKDDVKEKISSFSVSLALASEYCDEQEKQYKGINLLPKYVKEEQKFFQFAWHGFLVIPLLFGAAFFFTLHILENQKEIALLNDEIVLQTRLQRQNQELLDQISAVNTKISGFDQTQTILDSAAVGTEIWGNLLENTSSFYGKRKNLWITKLSNEGGNNIFFEGYSLSKNVLPELAYYFDAATLNEMKYEDLREQDAYKYILNFQMPKKLRENNEP